MNKNRPREREAANRLSNLRGKGGEGGVKGEEISQRTCVHAYGPGQWPWTMGGKRGAVRTHVGRGLGWEWGDDVNYVIP